MSWLVFALCGPVLWAISTHLDKYLIERYFKDSSVAVLLIFTALIGLVSLPPIALLDPKVLTVGATAAGLMGLAGILYMAALLFYLRALQSEEASVVAPFFQASPLIAYGLGYLVLGETLSARQLAGGALIVGGTMLVSVRFGGGGARFKGRLAALMLFCALLLAVSALIFKVFALTEEFWPTTFWLYVGEALFGVALLAIAPYRREFTSLLRASPGPVLSINAANELVNLGGGLASRYALLFAPLSLVQAIGSTTTIFVFMIGVALSVFAPSLAREDTAPAELRRKGFAAVLVAIGVVLVTG